MKKRRRLKKRRRAKKEDRLSRILTKNRDRTKPPMIMKDKTKYNRKNKNYRQTSDPKQIMKTMQFLSDRVPEIKTIVIDTINAVMIDDEMKRMKQKGYDKWINLATSVFDIIQLSNRLRGDLIIFNMFHVESFLEDDGKRVSRILTNGKKLEKLKLETKIPIVLYARVEGISGNNEHYFETRANQSTSKTPKGMFEDFKIANDLQLVINKINEYNS